MPPGWLWPCTDSRSITELCCSLPGRLRPGVIQARAPSVPAGPTSDPGDCWSHPTPWVAGSGLGSEGEGAALAAGVSWERKKCLVQK